MTSVTPPDSLYSHWRRGLLYWDHFANWRKIPPEASVRRGSGGVLCDRCGLELYEHPKYWYPGKSIDIGSCVVRTRDGKFFHL